MLRLDLFGRRLMRLRVEVQLAVSASADPHRLMPYDGRKPRPGSLGAEPLAVAQRDLKAARERFPGIVVAQRIAARDAQERPLDRLEHRRAEPPLRAAMRQLKPDQRRALILFYAMDASRADGGRYRRIVRATGWSYTKVNRSLTEGRAALRALLLDRESVAGPLSRRRPAGATL